MTTKVYLAGAGIGALLVLWAARGCEHFPTPLPAPVAASIAEHNAEHALDSAAIGGWRARADSAAEQEALDERRAARAQRAARQDNVRAVPAAKELRLGIAFANESLALVQADARGAALDSGLTRAMAYSASGDTLLRQVVAVAESRQAPCRVAHVFPCPSRRAVALCAALFGFAAAKGWVSAAVSAAARVR